MEAYSKFSIVYASHVLYFFFIFRFCFPCSVLAYYYADINM